MSTAIDGGRDHLGGRNARCVVVPLPLTHAISRLELEPEAIGGDSTDYALGDSLAAAAEFGATAVEPSAIVSQGKITGSSDTPRCAWCRMSMLAQTYNSGSRLYREHRASRSLVDCPSANGSIRCEMADAQMNRIVEAIELGPKWAEVVLTIISVSDEVELVKERRRKAEERMKRLGRAGIRWPLR